MKLSYADIISPFPYKTNVGTIKSPKLRDIWELGYKVYQIYLSFLVISIDEYCKNTDSLQQWYNDLSENDKSKITKFNLCIVNEEFAAQFQTIFDFFFVEDVIWDTNNQVFVVLDSPDKKIVGIINDKIFPDVVNLICQLNHITVEEDISVVTNKKAKSIMEKLADGRKKMKEKQSINKDYELENVISSIANIHSSLNILNIWDLTVNQLWDVFNRMINNNIYKLNQTSVSVWGNENKQFNPNDWCKNLEHDD